MLARAAISKPSILPSRGTISIKSAPVRVRPSKTAAERVRLWRGDKVIALSERNGYYDVFTMFYEPGDTNKKPMEGWLPKWAVRLHPSGGKIPTFQISELDIHHIPDDILRQAALGQQPSDINAPASHANTPAPFSPPVRRTYHLLPADAYTGRVALSDTQGKWWKAEECGGCIHFKDAAIISDEFSAEVAIDGAIIKQTARPVRVDLVVTVYDMDKKPIARDTVSIYNVDSDGGDYTLSGPSVFPRGDEQAAYCSIKLSGIWMPK